ncbi:MAG TPA: protein kinase [Gemmatimonadales bacterium]|nr:protein kinase [Gemmatimonadales bacterium]
MAELLERLQAALGDGFRIERELGGGGMSHVFLAEEVRLGRRVVIKLLPPEAAEGIPADRFEREIKVAASLQHPHVVPVLSAGIADGLLYYVMPYIDGESLASRLARTGALPVGEAVRILRDVADALAYAHGRGVVHRDIKPDNIMLAGRHALVTDFGVAKAVSASTNRTMGLTTGGVTIGTPTYMAPEQAAADPNLDHRADIYALGVVAYEMLCGRPPFMAPTPQGMLAAHVTQAPEPVSAYRQTIPPDISQIVMRCLAKHPADRWQSAAELGEQLEIATTPSGGTPSVPTAPVPAVRVAAERSARRAHPARVALLFGLATVAVTGIAFLLTRMLDLADWVWIGALVCMLAGFPIMLYTGRLERKRAILKATGAFRYEPEPAHQQWFTWRRALWGGGLALGALLLATVGYGVSRHFGIGPGATLLSAGTLSNEDRLVLADFENHTADSTLSTSLSEALRVDLGQSSAVRLVNQQEIGQTLQRMGQQPGTALTETLARDVARRANAKAVVSGDVSSLGTGYVLTARLVSVDGTTLAPVRETAESDADLIPALNRLSKSLRQKIGESLRTIRSSDPLEQVTTASLPALELYSRAQRAFDVNDYPTARDLLVRAVQTDTSFAMAWRKLAVVINNMAGSATQQRDAASAAFRHRDRLPPMERALTEAYYYSNVQYKPDEVIRSYQRALDLDSLNPVAINNLGLIYNTIGEFASAEAILRRGMRHQPSLTMYDNLNQSLLSQGKYAAVDTVLEELKARAPNATITRVNQAVAASVKREYDKMDSLLRPAATGDQPPRAVQLYLSNVLEVHGQLREEDALFSELATRLLAEGDSSLAAGLLLARPGHDLIQRGQTARGVSLLDSLQRTPLFTSLRGQDRPFMGLAELQVSLGRATEVRRLRAEWERAVPEAERRPWQEPRWDALVAGAEGRWKDAALAATRAVSASHCSPCGRHFVAQAWDRAGVPDSALKYYEQAATLPNTDDTGVEDAIWQPSTLRRLGELYESRGDKTKALNYYGQFVALWKNADPDLQPQVKQVKETMAKLAGE